jgi:hypothetical protein
VAAGLTVSAVRWMVIDRLHHMTGIPYPDWDFSRLQKSISAFSTLIEIHYRHYQFYANMLVAVVFLYCCRRTALGFWTAPFGWTDAAFLALAVIFYVTSRDTLRKYYDRGRALLSERPSPPKLKSVVARQSADAGHENTAHKMLPKDKNPRTLKRAKR